MYSRVFRSVPRLARRVHFFGCTPDGKALSDVDLYSMSDAFTGLSQVSCGAGGGGEELCEGSGHFA